MLPEGVILAKTITWRIISILCSILIAWLVTGNFETGLKLGTLDLVLKSGLYYLHEKHWIKKQK